MARRSSDPGATAPWWPGLRGLAAEKAIPVRVQGECMTPGIPPGATVWVAPRRVYLPGDVLAFRGRDGKLLLHRLIGWRPWQGRLHLVTRADAGDRPDPPLPPERVLGRAAVSVSWKQRLRAMAAFAGLVLAKTFPR